MFFVDLPSTGKKNKDIHLGGNSACEHIPTAMVQFRYLTVTSTSRYVLITSDEKRGAGIIQNHWNGNLTSIPATSKISPTFLHLTSICHILKKTKHVPLP